MHVPYNHHDYELSEKLILIADDNIYSRNLVKYLLRLIGFSKIEFVYSSANITKEVENILPSLLIINTSLQTIDVLSLIYEIRHASTDIKEIPILLISRDPTNKFVSNARDAGATEHIATPFCFSVFFNHIIECFHSPRQFVEIDNFYGPDRRRKSVEIHTDRRFND